MVTKTDCKHEHHVSIDTKHDDRCCISIPHLGIDEDGYMPHLGILGGDYTRLKICLKCGQIEGWKEITDVEIKGSDTFQHMFEEE